MWTACYIGGECKLSQKSIPFPDARAGVLLLQSQDNASGCFPRLTLNHARDSVHTGADLASYGL